MQNLKSANLASEVPLSKLLDIDSDLAAQETQLLAELELIQEKRKSLQTVLTLFSGSPTSLSNLPTPTTAEPPVVPEAPVPSTIETTVEDSTPVTVEPSLGVESNGSASKSPHDQKTRRSKSETKSAATSARSGKTRRGQDLQQYIRAEFNQSSLSQAVGMVLQQQPKDVVGIPEIIDSIFIEDTPKQVRSVASNRISTILSTGQKANKWYRGRTGRYSISQSAASADLKS
ncbi:hypothetical protein IQ268_23825 [Oculatella sp. LEGE 06141]|uniref:hypothetical protein n=1 Tax=Oculatella sp. LEGE 06141 TaxID=1828648 RepID=UPI0018804F85|nr:hypothetical protein [Oculatella sp. LEGE 06141]MBE9181597.1 hypothetical protein [Oculatella sp. LEGE 06141]